MNADGGYLCTDCGKEFETALVYGLHRETAHGIKRDTSKPRLAYPPPPIEAKAFACKQCAHVEATSLGMARHVRFGHPGSATIDTPPKSKKPGKTVVKALTIRLPEPIYDALMRQVAKENAPSPSEWIIAAVAQAAGMRRKAIVQIVGHEWAEA